MTTSAFTTVALATVVFFVGVLMDYRTTRAALARGARELNPVFGRKGERLWLYIPLNVAFYLVLLVDWSLTGQPVLVAMMNLWGAIRLLVAWHNEAVSK